MPREIRSTTIGGREYRVMQMGTNTASAVMFRVMRALPGILLGGGFDLQSLSYEDFVFVRDSLVAGAKVGIVDTKGDGRVTFIDLATQLDNCFAGNTAQFFELLAFAWKENNLNEVFSVVVDAIARRGQSATSASPTEATGTSGDSSSRPA